MVKLFLSWGEREGRTEQNTTQPASSNHIFCCFFTHSPHTHHTTKHKLSCDIRQGQSFHLCGRVAFALPPSQRAPLYAAQLHTTNNVHSILTTKEDIATPNKREPGANTFYALSGKEERHKTKLLGKEHSTARSLE